jgi:hypothetical protein
MRTLLTAAAASIMLATSAGAAEVTQTAEFDAGARKVWRTANKDFCGIGDWHPAVEKCELSDKKTTRTLTLKGGGTIVEKRTEWDKKKMTYSYEIVESPLPVSNYKSTFKVEKGKKKSSTVTWSSTFEPKGDEAEAKKAIDGIYTTGLDALKTKVSQAADKKGGKDEDEGDDEN